MLVRQFSANGLLELIAPTLKPAPLPPPPTLLPVRLPPPACIGDRIPNRRERLAIRVLIGVAPPPPLVVEVVDAVLFVPIQGVIAGVELASTSDLLVKKLFFFIFISLLIRYLFIIWAF